MKQNENERMENERMEHVLNIFKIINTPHIYTYILVHNIIHFFTKLYNIFNKIQFILKI